MSQCIYECKDCKQEWTAASPQDAVLATGRRVCCPTCGQVAWWKGNVPAESAASQRCHFLEHGYLFFYWPVGKSCRTSLEFPTLAEAEAWIQANQTSIHEGELYERRLIRSYVVTDFGRQVRRQAGIQDAQAEGS